MAQLKANDINRLDSSIKYLERMAFDHMNDEICTAIAVLQTYRREILMGERKQRVISQ